MPETSKDRETVARQLGRTPKPFRVAARCPFGAPSVIENEKARNMPTRFWITCPHLASVISGVESAGGVRAAQAEVGKDEVAAVHSEHLARYGSRVAGVREGGHVKCLHAFTALHLAEAIPNPIAEWTLAHLEETYPDYECCLR